MNASKNSAVWLVVLGVLGCSMSSVFGRLTTASGLVTAMYRMLFTAILLLPVVLLKNLEELKSLDRKDVLMCMLSGVFLGLHFAFYLTSLKYTSVASCVVLVDTEVLFVALALVLIFKEKLSGKAVCGIVLALIGSIVIALADRSAGGPGSNVLFGDALAVAGAVSSAVYTLIGTKQRKHLSTTVYTFIVYSAAALTLVAGCLIFGERFTGYPVTDYLCCLGMTVFCTLLGHSLFSYSLAFVSPAFVSMAKLGEPVFSAILAVFLFSEVPGGMQIAGGIAVIMGIMLYIRSMKNKEKSNEKL